MGHCGTDAKRPDRSEASADIKVSSIRIWPLLRLNTIHSTRHFISETCVRAVSTAVPKYQLAPLPPPLLAPPRRQLLLLRLFVATTKHCDDHERSALQLPFGSSAACSSCNADASETPGRVQRSIRSSSESV